MSTTNAGGQFNITIPFTQDGSPLNLTGATAARFSLKADPGADDSTELISKTLGSGITIPNPTDGKVVVTITAADTIALPIQSRCIQTAIGTMYSNGEANYYIGCYVTMPGGVIHYSGTQALPIAGSIRRSLT